MNPAMNSLRAPPWARRRLLAPVGMPPSASSLPPIIPMVRRWRNDFRHPRHGLLTDPPSHRRDTRAPEAARYLTHALAFRHLLARGRRQYVRRIPELDLPRRAEPSLLPIDRRCAARTQGAFPHSLFAPPVAAPGAHRVRTPRGPQPRPRLRAPRRPLSY